MSLAAYARVAGSKRAQPPGKQPMERSATGDAPRVVQAPKRSLSDPTALEIMGSDLGKAMPKLAEKIAAISSINLHDAEEIMAAANPRLVAQMNATVRM